MRIVFLLLMASGGLGAASAQTPTAPVAVPVATPLAPLAVTDAERQYFELGDVLAQAAFTYSPLAKQARQVSRLGMTDAQLAQIARLAPEALRARDGARSLCARAVTLLQALNAPPDVLAPVATLSAHLGKPLTASGAAQPVAALNHDAGTVLAALDESNQLSGVLDNKALQRWAMWAGSDRTGRVWYAEGLMAGVAQIAATQSQPDLLPPVADLATDLRGLRDWLSLRMPETPTPDQAALQTDINAFLAQTANNAHRRPRMLTAAQVHDLGEISRLLQGQILPPDSPVVASLNKATTTPPPAPVAHKAPEAVPTDPDSTDGVKRPQGLL